MSEAASADRRVAEARLEQGSPDRFGYEWDRYSTILPESRVQLQRWLGTTPLESFAGLSVLDVGCGMGRNPYWMADAGARRVVAVDVDPRSVAAARQNLARFPQATVREVSVYDLDPAELADDDLSSAGLSSDEPSRDGLSSDEPSRKEQGFDRVTCIGVVHHLADPEAAVRRLWSCVAPGGELHLWVYGKEGNRLLLPIIQAFRAAGSRLPIRWTHRLARLVTLVAWPAFRLLPFRTDYYRFLKTLSFGNVESIIFDQMLPKIAHYWTREEVENLVDPLGGEALVERVQGNSWHVRVRRA